MGNLLCGTVSIVLASKGMIDLAVCAIVMAYLFDAIDGHLARIFIRKPSEMSKRFGAELDNLSDMVSFGVAPFSCFFFGLIDGTVSGSLFWILGAAGLLYPLFAQFRLARFAAISGGGSFFWGLNSPAAGLSLASLVWILTWVDSSWLWPQFSGLGVLLGLAFLMTSRVRYSHTRTWFGELPSVGFGLWSLAALAFGVTLSLGGSVWNAAGFGLVAFWSAYVFISPMWHHVRGHYR